MAAASRCRRPVLQGSQRQTSRRLHTKRNRLKDRPSKIIKLTASTLAAGQRVLVVEDNIDVGRFCTQILDDLGYVPTWAMNAEEALEKLGDDGNGFEAVFSDVVMPGMGGVALAETLRERMPLLPVVLASGYSHVLARDTDHGFELLQKPYSAEQLARVLQRVMGKASVKRRSEVPS